MLSSKCLQSQSAGAVAGNDCGDLFSSSIWAVVTITFHPPMLTARTRLHRLHLPYRLRLNTNSPLTRCWFNR